MNQQEFVDEVVKSLVRDSALRILMENLEEDPAASKLEYPESLRKSIVWFRELSSQDQAHVLSIAKKAIHSTVFRFLACLDGAKVIDNDGGSLALYYCSEHGTNSVLLANVSAESYLHDLYMEDYPTWLEK